MSPASHSLPRHAPVVRYPVAPSGYVRLVLCGVSALAGAVLCGWWWGGSAQGWAPRIAGFALWLFASLHAWSWWRQSAQGSLSWDGAQWTWSPATGGDRAAVIGAVAIRWDLQSALLLSFAVPNGATQWLWLEARHATADWHALRRAAYAHSLVDGVADKVPFFGGHPPS